MLLRWCQQPKPFSLVRTGRLPRNVPLVLTKLCYAIRNHLAAKKRPLVTGSVQTYFPGMYSMRRSGQQTRYF